MMDAKFVNEVVMDELKNQELKWGVQCHPPVWWVSILLEEVGEVARAVNEAKMPDYTNELIQVIAVATNAIISYHHGSMDFTGAPAMKRKVLISERNK
jgi:NTP pyrophosphatase (non-canonical NTP hydrolase)